MENENKLPDDTGKGIFPDYDQRKINNQYAHKIPGVGKNAAQKYCISNRLGEIMALRGLSINALSRKSGISRQTLLNIKKRSTTFPHDILLTTGMLITDALTQLTGVQYDLRDIFSIKRKE